MNQVHVHLFITHLPIFGSLLGTLVLIHALWAKSNTTKIAAYNIFILSALGAGVAYFTGEGAEEAVEHLAGVIRRTIHEHEEFAFIALISMIVLGLASIMGIFLTVKKSSRIRSVALIILLLSLISFGLAIRTGYLGGKIRHTETEAIPSAQEQGGEQEHQDQVHEEEH